MEASKYSISGFKVRYCPVITPFGALHFEVLFGGPPVEYVWNDACIAGSSQAFTNIESKRVFLQSLMRNWQVLGYHDAGYGTFILGLEHQNFHGAAIDVDDLLRIAHDSLHWVRHSIWLLLHPVEFNGVGNFTKALS